MDTNRPLQLQNTYTTKCDADTEEVAWELLSHVRQQDTAMVIALRGNLGSGKTTFTKCFARHLGVEQVVASPTFVIERVYPIAYEGFNLFVHIDAYRMKHAADLLAIGWNDLVAEPTTIVCIEWPELVSPLADNPTVQLVFEYGENENERIIQLYA
jgi:tRNA threonylcarbamoyladenosine biosynthesis protein TsaE